MTISGGEPTMQYDFLMTILQTCRQEGMSTAIETCGVCPSERFKWITALCDEVLFDIKLLDSSEHQKYTGADNLLILNNLNIACAKTTATVRVPLIPNVNMNSSFYDDLIDLLKDLNINKVELLPYHRLGINKYDKLDMASLCRGIRIPNEIDVSIAKKILSKALDVKVVH